MTTHAPLRTPILVVLILIVGTLSFLVIKPFFIPLALAVIFAVALYPLYRLILSELGGRRGLAALLTEIVAIICILVPLSVVGTRLVSESERIVTYFAAPDSFSNLSIQATTLATRLDGTIPGASDYVLSITTQANRLFQQAVSWLLAHSGYAFAQTISFLLSLFIFLIALFFFLKDANKFGPRLEHLSPLPVEDTNTLAHRLVLTVYSVVRGNLTIALIQGIIATIGFLIFGVPNALVWGLCTSVAALVPGIGTTLILGPAVLYLFITGQTGDGIGMLIWSIAAVGLVDNILGPRLVGSGSQLHPLLVLVSVLGGITFFGASGIFLGPLVMSLLMGLLEVYAPEAKRSAHTTSHS